MAHSKASLHGVPVTHPARWAIQRVERSGWFTTGVTWRLPDGTVARWASRMARRQGQVEVRDSAGAPVRVIGAQRATARRLTRANAAAALSFTLGGSLFALGVLLAEFDLGSARSVDLVYLVGGVFFSLGGYVSVLQATNSPTDIDELGALTAPRWRWWGVRARDLGWLSAFVLFIGTLFFALSLVSAFAENLTPRQADGWIWLPDMVGCVCFLVSGHLALVEIGVGRIWRVGSGLDWWIVSVIQVGSILFFLAGLAAFVRPSTSDVLNLALVNWGTFAGAVLFAIGGLLQLREKPAQ